MLKFEFSEYDFEKLARELKVEENAINQASNNRPPLTDTVLDPPQQRIVQCLTTALVTFKEKAVNRLDYLQRRRKEIEEDISSSIVDGIPQEAELEASRVQAMRRSNLVELRKDERVMFRNRSAFKAMNNLNREPQYPESHTLHWSIVIASVVAESFLNSYFFAKGSDLGLIGGAFQAFIISVANVGTALLGGIFVFREFNHVNRKRRRVAFSVSGFYFLIMIAFNLATAHYRVLLEISPLTAMIKAIPRLFQNPFAIDNLDAWVLFIIGLVFLTVAGRKGYTSDDVYPGYGEVDRQYLNARDKYTTGKSIFIGEINAIFIGKTQEIKALLQRISREQTEYFRSLNDSEGTVKEFNEVPIFLQQKANALLNCYRDKNSQVRGCDGPAYFKEEFKFDESQSRLTVDLSKETEIGRELVKAKDRLTEKAATALDEIRKYNDKLLTQISDFFEKIEEEANRLIGEDVPRLQVVRGNEEARQVREGTNR